MPNHVTNIIRAPKHVLDFLRDGEQKALAASAEPGTDAAKVMSGVEAAEEKREVDFNHVVPMPDNIFQGDIGEAERKLYGVNTWYQWCPDNWGTKWNAYSVERVDEHTVRFDTAWAHPSPILNALSERFENEPIAVIYADEDFGYNVGKYVILGGERTSDDSPEDGSFEAYELAAAVKYNQSIVDWLADIREDYDEDEWAQYYGDVEAEAKRRASAPAEVTSAE